MKNVTSSFWFWLLILGIFLILFAAILAGGLQETNNWVWGLFVVGSILAVLGIIFAMIAWLNVRPCEIEVKSPEITDSPYLLSNSIGYNSPSPLALSLIHI